MSRIMGFSPLFPFCFLLCVSATLPALSVAQTWDVKAFAQKLTDHVFPQVGSKEADLIAELPGQPANVNFRQYSGYIAVDSTATRNLFYYLVEAAEDQKDTKPLVLWLSSGVGISTIGSGALEQHGPFLIQGTSDLQANPYAWNTVANMLYLESPVGVGFSYTKNASDSCTGDEMAAIDNYRFILNWLNRFPEYKTRDFFLAGEEYAGNYATQLADVISFYNKQQKLINLKGIILGNPALDAFEDARGKFAYLSGHGLISDERSNAIKEVCRCAGCSESSQCYAALVNAAPFAATYNLEDIYDPPCSFLPNFSPGSVFNDAQNMYGCGRDDNVTMYLNLPQVQSAMHVKLDAVKRAWATVNLEVWHTYQTKYNSSIPILKNLMAAGIPVWIYSGDFDSLNPVTATQFSLRLLALKVQKPWRGWYKSNTELAGMALTYQGNLTFLTIREAGHYVHLKQPASAMVMFHSIVGGKDLPRSQFFAF